jgi:hypothetical protein
MIEILSLLFGCLGMYLAWLEFKRARRNWRQFIAEHPPIPYTASDVAEPWRWSDPPPTIDLVKEDTSDTSLLRLKNIRNNMNVVGTILSFLLFAFALFMFVYVFILHPEPGIQVFRIIVTGLLVYGGWSVLYLDSRLVAIELSPKKAIFVVRYGVILFRRFTYRLGGVSFSGKTQSDLSMARNQKCPNYYVYVNRWWWTKRYVTDCDPSQGSWLVAGLDYWKCHTSDIQSGKST